jgi:hypothetical protein
MATKTRQIKNTNLLYEAGIMNDGILAKLDEAGKLHKQYSNIEFKILRATEQEVDIRVTQGKVITGIYHGKERLVEIVHETFDSLFPGIKIHARAFPYELPPSSIVTPEWIEKKMTKLKIGHKDLIKDLGMNKANVSVYLSGDRPMSDVIKNVFYYYFSYRELAS